MANASYVQSDFSGGEWAPEVQGHAEADTYKRGMNRCLNWLPVEQGALFRRPGFQRLGATRLTLPAKLVSFDVTGNQVVLEFTNDDYASNPATSNAHVRFWQYRNIYTVPPSGVTAQIIDGSWLANGRAQLASISNGNPVTVTTGAAHGFTSGDYVFFTFDYWEPGDPAPNIAYLGGLAFPIRVTGATTFVLQKWNSVGGGYADLASWGSTFTAPASGTGLKYTVTRIAELQTPYTAAAVGSNVVFPQTQLRFCQDESQLIIFHPKFAPRTLQVTPASGFGFTLSTLPLYDGPYFDINKTTTTLTCSAVSGSVTITASAATGINGGSGFLSTDVGRHVRMFNTPAAWDSTSNAYIVGSVVLYTDGNAYVALKTDNGPASNNGVAAPPGNVDHWALIGNPSLWCWAKITAVTNTTHVTATIEQSTQSMNVALYTNTATTQWQLGLYSDTTGYPTCGDFHENRLWMAGVVANRLDGSMVGGSSMADAGYGTFSPTADDGTVGDSNAIAAIAKTNENTNILWVSSDDQGLLFGNLSSEWKLKASALDDPLTPSSTQVRRITKYGTQSGRLKSQYYPPILLYAAELGNNVDFLDEQQIAPVSGIAPIVAERMHIFIQRMGRKVIELGHPSEAGYFYTPNITADLTYTAPHLTVNQVAEAVYCQQPKPFIWARRYDGNLIGCTYLRSENKLISGWHQHVIGSGNANIRQIMSIASAPDLGQTSDHLWAVVGPSLPQPAAELGFSVERMTDIFDDNRPDDQFFHLDGAVVPLSARLATTLGGDGFDGIRVYGTMDFNYSTLVLGNIAGTVAGVDMGNATAVSAGVMDFPYNGDFTLAFLQTLPMYTTQNIDRTQYHTLIDIDGMGNYYLASMAVGYVYTSQGQLLRPNHGEDAGARAGPAMGKIRRNHWYAALLYRTQGDLTFGTDFTNLHPADLTPYGDSVVTAQPALFSGTITTTIDDDYSMDGMLSFQMTRPLPCTLVSIAGYIETQDK